MQDTDLPNEVESTTPDFKTELAAKLQELVPEAISDGKVDTQKLKELLDDDATDDSERFGLFWPGKKRAMRAAQEPTTATLKPAKDESKDWDTTENLFIEGDNLEVLKVLQKHYHNKIKMIYIDPPYNTGKDFVYPDNYKEGLVSYLEFTNQVDGEGRKTSTNSDTDGRYHSNWLNMMYPRLKLARNLLTDDGVIFISIDDAEHANLKKICDEIFGESNFVASISVINNIAGRSDREHIATANDYVLVYTRSDKWLSTGLPLSDSQLAEYKYEDARGKYRLQGLRKRGSGAKRSDRPNMFYPVYYSPSTNSVSLIKIPANDTVEILPKLSNGEDGRWRWGKDTFEAKKEYIEVRVGPGVDNIFEKSYIETNDGQKTTKMKSYLLDGKYTSDVGTQETRKLLGAKIFDTPKPVSLIEDFCRILNDKSAIILDFFSGSGTTAHAVMKLNADDGGNRKHIQVQLPEPTNEKSDAYKAGYHTVSAIAIERIKLAGEMITKEYEDKLAKREQPLDTGYRFYKLADTNFTKWQSSSDTDKDTIQQQLLEIRESSNDAATEEDLLTEVLLKQGISLTAPLKHADIEGLSAWVVGDNIVAAYLNEHVKPSLDQLRAIVATEPAKFIIIEDAFQGDDELKTNLVQICKSQKIELWTV